MQHNLVPAGLARRLWPIVLLVGGLLRADPVIDSSSATFTLDPDSGFIGDEVSSTKSPLDLPHSVPPWDFDQTVTVGGSSASAKGSVFHLETSSLFGLTFPGDTGVSQTNAGDFSAATVFTIDFTGTWTIDGIQFGPTLYGYANFGFTGEVSSSPGSYIRVQLDGAFTGDATRSPVSYDSGLITAPGTWTDAFFNQEVMTPDHLLVGQSETIAGTLIFTVYASNGTSTIGLSRYSGAIPEAADSALLFGLTGLIAIVCRKRIARA